MTKYFLSDYLTLPFTYKKFSLSLIKKASALGGQCPTCKRNIAVLVCMKYIFQPHPQPLSLLRRGERLRQQMRGEVTTVLHRSQKRYRLRQSLVTGISSLRLETSLKYFLSDYLTLAFTYKKIFPLRNRGEGCPTGQGEVP